MNFGDDKVLKVYKNDESETSSDTVEENKDHSHSHDGKDSS